MADFAKDLNASLLEMTASIKASSGSTRSKKMSKMLSNALGGNKKNGSTSSSNIKNKKREFIARVENERMKMVLKHPTFKENPVKAVLTHLAAQLENMDERTDEEDEGNGKNAGKNENNTPANAKKKRKMTPAQLRQTQGEHHAGTSERSKKNIHRSSAAGGGGAKAKKPKRKSGQ